MEEDSIEKRIKDFIEKEDFSNSKWLGKNKSEEEIKNVFEDLNQITGFQIIKSNPRLGRFSHEPFDGTIKYNEKAYYFKFSHEFDEGNTYIVYENNNPIFYFLLYSDSEGEVNSSMRFEPS